MQYFECYLGLKSYAFLIVIRKLRQKKLLA